MATTPLERLPKAAEKAADVSAKAAEAVAQRDRLIYEATQAKPRPTHAQIAQAAGLTPWRIQQILKRERDARA